MENEQITLRELTRGLTADETIARLTEYIADHPESDEALTMRGMRYWGLQRRADAINDYLAAIRLNPESRAANALKATNEILDYYNKDLYNP